MSEPPAVPGRVSFVQLGGAELAVVSYSIDARLDRLPDDLTDTDRDVLMRILRGESNDEIATARGTVVATVKKQVSSLLRRFGVSSRSELVARIRWGRDEGR